MIAGLITHLNATIAANPSMMAYLKYKRVLPLVVTDPSLGYPQITLDYYDAIPVNNKDIYDEVVRAHLILWTDNSPKEIEKANTMSVLLATLLKKSSFDGIAVRVVGRASLPVDATSNKARTRIQLDLNS